LRLYLVLVLGLGISAALPPPPPNEIETWTHVSRHRAPGWVGSRCRSEWSRSANSDQAWCGCVADGWFRVIDPGDVMVYLPIAGGCSEASLLVSQMHARTKVMTPGSKWLGRLVVHLSGCCCGCIVASVELSIVQCRPESPRPSPNLATGLMSAFVQCVRASVP
jgi:hypothetical protein